MNTNGSFVFSVLHNYRHPNLSCMMIIYLRWDNSIEYLVTELCRQEAITTRAQWLRITDYGIQNLRSPSMISWLPPNLA